MTTLTRYLLLAVTAGLVGCGGASTGDGKTVPDPLGGGEETKIALLVSAVNDDKSSPKVMARHFAKGAVPKETKKYPLYAYEVLDKPAISGETATAKVKLKNEQKGTEAADQEWTFVKEGGEWKVKTAPLP